MGQTLKFLAPVSPSDMVRAEVTVTVTVTATVTVTDMDIAKRRVKLECACSVLGKKVLVGEASTGSTKKV